MKQSKIITTLAKYTAFEKSHNNAWKDIWRYKKDIWKYIYKKIKNVIKSTEYKKFL